MFYFKFFLLCISTKKQLHVFSEQLLLSEKFVKPAVRFLPLLFMMCTCLSALFTKCCATLCQPCMRQTLYGFIDWQHDWKLPGLKHWVGSVDLSLADRGRSVMTHRKSKLLIHRVSVTENSNARTALKAIRRKRGQRFDESDDNDD